MTTPPEQPSGGITPPDESKAGDPTAKPDGGDGAKPPFAPGEPNDGRVEGDYESKYGKEFWVQIAVEAAYLLCVFVASAWLLFSLGPRQSDPPAFVWLTSGEWASARPYALAFFGGSLGGTLFAMKWLYHSVAKHIWNRDRILWRLFAPLLSGGAATTFVILSGSGVIPLFGRELATSAGGATGLGLLIGFFSDRAFSMLENTIQTLFGSPASQEKPRPDSADG